MPSIAAHMVIAKLVGKKLNKYNSNFIKGNLLPDIVDKPKDESHYKIDGTYYRIPDIDYIKNILDLHNDLDLGCYTHFLLDKYYLEDFIVQHTNNKSIFEDKKIYNDYSIINYPLVKEYNLDTDYLKEVLSNYNEEISIDKLNDNISFLLSKEYGNTTYIDCDSFSKFLYDVSNKIYEEVKDYDS